MQYVGMDVHWRQTTICILDENGRRVKMLTVRGAWEKVLGELSRIAGAWQVCFEASCGYGWLYERLKKMAQKVVVAHPGQLRLIFRSKRKNDRVTPRSWRSCCIWTKCRPCTFLRWRCEAGGP